MGIFLSSPLWMNKTIKIENKPVFYEDWFRKGICFVNDIMSEDGKFLSIDQFVPRIRWLILYCNHCSLVFCVTIKGSLNISLHFVSSKPKAKISSHFF
jgi:hypothetical protein